MNYMFSNCLIATVNAEREIKVAYNATETNLNPPDYWDDPVEPDDEGDDMRLEQAERLHDLNQLKTKYMPLTLSERRQIKEEKLLLDIYRDILKRSIDLSEWEENVLNQISEILPGACKQIDRQILGE